MQRIILRHEKRMALAVFKEKQRVTALAFSNFMAFANIRKNSLDFEHEEKITAILREYYAIIIEAQAGYSANIAKSFAGWEEKQEEIRPFLRLVDMWMRQNGLRKAKEIAGTTFDDILGIVSEGAQAGEGTQAVARQILKKAPVLSKWRSQAIARTELNGAANFANSAIVKEAAEDVGLSLFKRWLPVEDGRTRPAHAAMESAPAIPEAEKFMVGGEPMDRPHDPNASAANVVNCRCTLLYEEAPENEFE